MNEPQPNNKKRTEPEKLDEGVEILPDENQEKTPTQTGVVNLQPTEPVVGKVADEKMPTPQETSVDVAKQTTKTEVVEKSQPSPKDSEKQVSQIQNDVDKQIKIPNEQTKKPEKLEVKLKKEKSILQTIRTYQSDVSNVLKNQKISLTKMVLAEKSKKERGRVSNTPHKKVSKKTIIVGIITLVIIISSFAGFFVLSSPKNTQKVKITELNIPNIIFPNYEREIFLKKLNKNNIVEAIIEEEKNISVPLGSIVQTYLTKEDPSKTYVIENTKGYKLLVTSEVLLNSLETRAPASMTRALGPDFMFGFHSSLGNNPFLLFRVNSYENVFAGMLEWERTMYNDLEGIFKREDSSLDEGIQTFKDIIIINRDVRAILNSQGKIEFAYSFPNKNTLIITNNETTLEELYRRITTAQLERKD